MARTRDELLDASPRFRLTRKRKTSRPLLFDQFILISSKSKARFFFALREKNLRRASITLALRFRNSI